LGLGIVGRGAQTGALLLLLQHLELQAAQSLDFHLVGRGLAERRILFVVGGLALGLISASVAPSSLRSLVARVWGDDCDVCDWYGFASLAASLCSGGRAVGGVAVVSLLELGEGDGAFVIIAFPSLPRLAQVVS
jgi:hypothetical protein